MTEYHVAEIFTSINGEGPRSGQLALFIRMQGCNLACSYCDTRWACGAGEPDACGVMSAEEIAAAVRESGVRNVTLTGGEPLLQEGIAELLRLLGEEPGIRVEIETNGSIPLAPILAAAGAEDTQGSGGSKTWRRPSINMDYKLPGSGMEEYMLPENFDLLTHDDTVKFVVSGRKDLERSAVIITEYGLKERCRVYLSPVFGEIEPAEIAEFMKEHRMNDVTLQLQLHKIIWNPELRGV